MKKILVAISAIFALNATAQNVKFGAKAGLVSTNQDLSIGGNNFKNKLGLSLGVLADFSLSKTISIQPGLGFSSRGARESHNGHYDNYVINTIEIPVNIVYKTPAGKGNLIMGVGPNFGININAKVKGHDEPDEEVKIGNQPGELKMFDLGANFITGYEFKNNLFVQVNYNFGLSNLSNTANLSQKTVLAGITIGYFFSK